MDNNLNINFQSSLSFSEEILNEIPNASTLNKESKNVLLKKVKDEYQNNLKPEVKKLIDSKLEEENAVYQGLVKTIVDEKNAHLNDIETKWNAHSEEEKADKAIKKEYEDSKKGAEIVAKRALIKENNTHDSNVKLIKSEELSLYSDFMSVTKAIKGTKFSFVEPIQSKILELKANFSLKKALKDKKVWFNLMPLFMLIILIAAFFISNSITGYKGNLTDVINNGVFVAVVATGAVFIYSGGSFDMSLGPASLMCATIAAITWNASGNVILSLVVSLLIGALLGIVNAILANVLDLPVMVMTLTMMNILNSIHAVILQSQGNQLNVNEGLPATTIVYATFLVCFFLLLWAIFNYTKIGRRNKFIGSNQVAAKFSGVSLMKAGIISFAISGIGLGICGFLFASYNSGSSFSTGTILDTIGLNVVIAIVFGGMTTSGGPRSRVSCAIIGAFFCIFLDELFRSIGAADARFLAKGVVFLVVSFINMYSSRTKMLAR